MNNFETILYLVKKYSKNYVKILKSKIELFNEILDKTSFLNEIENLKFSTRVFYYLNHLSKFVKCKYCKKEMRQNFSALQTLDDIFCYDCRKKHFNEYVEKSLNENRIFLEEEIKAIENEFELNVRQHPENFNKYRISSWSRQFIYRLQYLNFKYPQLKLYSWDTKFYWWLHDLKDFPICEICKKPIVQNVLSISKGFTSTHFINCRIKKAENTNLIKYGVKNSGNSEIGRIHSKETMLLKYGVEYYSQTPEWKTKCIETSLEKYGIDHFNNYQKVKETNLKRYGVECTFQTEESKLKSKNTCIEKYGVENGFNIPKVRKNNILSKLNKLYSEFENKLVEPLFSKNDFFELSKKERHQNLFKWHCKKCNSNFLSKIIFDGGEKIEDIEHIHAKCPKCFSFNPSHQQTEIKQFIESFGLEIKYNTKSIISPLELDIYIPEKHLAIEFDGLYWHSEFKKEPNYHLNKTELCEKQGIHLIHIFENEWLYKKDIVKSKLKNLLGLYDHKCYARECEIKEISSKESIVFQNENHIQGSCKSKINIGLFYKNELVSLMTFSKHKFDKKHKWEMTKFCNKIGWHIPGGASKLLSYFEKTYKPKLLISYADRKWSNGNVYEKLGFKLDHVNLPDYWYFDKLYNLYPKTIFKKYKLKNLLEKFDPEKTEVENMHDNGYNRIFDCGSLIYEKRF